MVVLCTMGSCVVVLCTMPRKELDLCREALMPTVFRQCDDHVRWNVEQELLAIRLLAI